MLITKEIPHAIKQLSFGGKNIHHAKPAEDTVHIFQATICLHDFNCELLSLGIDLVAAQPLKGGQEAQLFLRTENVTHKMFGSFETSFQENDGNDAPWPIPNIVGVPLKS